MRGIERLIERIILASRWLLVIFYVGLALALALYAVSFIVRLAEVGLHFAALTEGETILAMLGLIDASLVASLIVMVMLSGYENFVGRFDQLVEGGVSKELSWLGKLDAGGLKLKVAASIVAISSIHLLQVFLNVGQYPTDKILWSTLLHLTFVGSALLMGVLDRITRESH